MSNTSVPELLYWNFSNLLTLISLWMHIKEYGILKPSQNLPQRSVKMDGFDKQDICVYCKVDTDSHLTIA